MSNLMINDQLFISEYVKNVAVVEIPKFLVSINLNELKKISLDISKAFNKGDFSDFIETTNDSLEAKLIKSFVKNVQLLVQKTWVEKSDEELKEETLYRINRLCDSLLSTEDGMSYSIAFSEYFSILYDVVFLLFGDLVKTKNFLDYTFRIDPDFGFFCYFVENISKIEEPSEEKSRLAILLTMFFLAEF